MFCGSAELCASAGAVCVFEAFLAIYRPGRGHDHHVGRDRGSRGLDCDPSGDRVRLGPGFPPSTPHNIGRRRGVAQPSELPRRVVESSSLRAICNVFPPDTNNPLPTRIQDRALQGQPQPPGPAVAPQSRFQQKPALCLP